MKPTALCLIDSSSILFRSYYGVRPLHTATGQPTHAIYGFCRALKKITDGLDPSHLVLVWDTKGPTFRHEAYDQYKATRQAPPSDLVTQKKAILEFVEMIGVRQVWKQGLEADDLLYSLAHDNLADQTVVITGDKDLHQLIDQRTTIFDPFKQKMITYDSFVAERGFEPEHLLLYHSLLGDSSDNIPGVRGIGAKTAEKLTKEFHTLDALYASLGSAIPSRTEKLLADQKEAAYLSQQLFTLKYEKTDLSLSDCTYDRQRWVHAKPFFHTYEFKPFFPSGVSDTNQQSIFGMVEAQPKAAEHTAWRPHLVTTTEGLNNLVKKLQTADMIALDTETRSLTPFRDGIVGISCAVDDTDAYYVPFGHSTGEEQLSQETVLAAFKPICEDASRPKVLQNAKFDQAGFAHYDIAVNGIVDDTLTMASLLRKSSESIGLKALSQRYLGEEMADYKDVAKGKKTFADVPLDKALHYAAHDARQTLKLQRVLAAELAKHPELEKLYREVELPLAGILWNMEHTGIDLDTVTLGSLATEVRTELDKIISKIDACLSGGQQRIDAASINLNSPQQLESVLFDQLDLPVIKKNKKTGSRSTDSEVLTELSKLHPVPGLIMKYREMTKLLNTYLDPLPNEINAATQRVHTTYSQTITATGRLSSSNPNLQNIPLGGGYGSRVRDAFVAPEGHVFLSADYSQIELRILAEFTKDPALRDAFAHDADIHRKTSALIFDVPEAEVTNEQRQVGKKINFSIMYGLTPFGLSKDLGITPTQAKTYIENYFTKYAGVKTWMDHTVEQAKQDGFVTTLLGRRRFVPGLHERNRHVQDAERRITINTPIQGTSADLIKLAMLSIDQKLTEEALKAYMVLQIHDELVLAVPHAEIERVTKLVENCMTHVVKGWTVPITVSTRVGDSWGECSK